METDLTVAVCMYNAARYIGETLACLMAQTRQDFHLMIIDDASTDGSPERVERFFRERPRQCELVRLAENGGIAAARDMALRRATTRYLVYIDADDHPQPALLEREHAALVADGELIGVSTWLDFMDAAGRKMKGGLYVGDTDKAAFRARAAAGKRIFLPIQTMFEREAALRVGGFTLTGFPEGRPRYRDYCEDLDLWTRMSDLYAEGRAIVVLPEALYHYRKADSLSANHFNMVIKMHYVKHNVRRRRAGLQDETFCAFMAALPAGELRRLRRGAAAADHLRNGAFYLRDGVRHLHVANMARGVADIVRSLCCRPTYLFDKLRNNLK